MINTVRFIEIVLERLIKEACDLQMKATDDLANEQVNGYIFIIERILGNAAGHDLLDCLPNYLSGFNPEFLVEYKEILEQQ